MTLKAPFPYFGGKSKVAHEVWHRLGDVVNFVEPFCGSAAVLLARPSRPRTETVNDANCFISNFWRAMAADPVALAEACDWPVNEADLHARHRWLMLSGASLEWRERMKRDPDHFDIKVAAWWVWGACQWIGAGWCDGTRIYGEGKSTHGKLPTLTRHKGVHSEVAAGEQAEMQRKRPSVTNDRGIHGAQAARMASLARQKPDLSGRDGTVGRGIHASGLTHKLPNLSGRLLGLGEIALPQQLPAVDGSGIHRKRPALSGNGPKGVQGRGGESNLLAWFGMLQQRLRRVRVTCGDWARVCTPAVTTGIGLTGVFLDPPYSEAAGRDNAIYAVEDTQVAHRVREWCLINGPNPLMRIALCGYAGEHEELERAGWRVFVWKTSGGYGNQTQGGRGHANRLLERIWFSPHCLSGQEDLFKEAA
jgi:hypothetical protein